MKKEKKHRLVLLAIIFITAVINEEFIAQTAHSNLKSIVKRSEVIVRGKVSEAISKWDKENSRILTKVSIDVLENYKGPETSKLVITHLGGEVGETGELYSHEPKFTQDEEVLIFAQKDKENNLRITKGHEGKFKVTTDQATGEKKIGANNSLKEFSTRIKSIINK
jgi:hypothetical protein